MTVEKLLIATALLLSLSTTAHAGPVIGSMEFVECRGAKGGLVCLDADGGLWKCPWGEPCTKT